MSIEEVKGQEPAGRYVAEFLPPLYREFFISVLDGKMTKPSLSEIAAVADNQISHATLTHLTNRQKTYYGRILLIITCLFFLIRSGIH